MGIASKRKQEPRVSAKNLPTTAVKAAGEEINLPSIPFSEDWSIVLTKGPAPDRPIFNVVNVASGTAVHKTTHLVSALEVALEADCCRVLGLWRVPWGSRSEWLRRLLQPMIVRPKFSSQVRGMLIKGGLQVATDLLKSALDKRHDATRAANAQTAFERMQRMQREMNR